MNRDTVLAITAGDRWQPGIGDPTVIGWLTVAAYLVATLFCWRATLASRKKGHKDQALFWGLFTSLLLLLGINKQLDLQTWFTLFDRRLAENEGWYPERRNFQAVFIACIAGLGASGLILFWRYARESVRHYRLALLGGVFLGCFVLIRAASFHYVDQMLGLSFDNITVNCILELGGILLVAIAALKG